MSVEKYNPELYNYRAFVTKVYDGDTITVDVDLGFGIKYEEIKIRLYGIDTPEVRGIERPEGLVSRDWLREKIFNKEILVKTIRDKTGKYGRYLGIIYLDGINLNDELVTKGLAIYREY